MRLRHVSLSSRRTRLVVGIALLLLIITLFYPLQTTIVPPWNLRVVDEEGVAVVGIHVSQHWQHHLLETYDHDDVLTTNSEGQVSFPVRTIRSSLFSRGVALVSKLMTGGSNPRFGPYSSVVIWGSKDHETTVAVYQYSQKPQTEVVAPRLK